MSDTYRAGDPDFETMRRRFYARCAKHLEFDGWRLEPKAIAASGEIGRAGVPREVEKYGNPGIASFRDNAADAMQWLIMKGHLNSKITGPRTDRALEIAWAEGRGRITSATRLADLFEKAELTPLRSPDFEAVPGGSFGPRHVGSVKLGSMMTVADLRADIPPVCMTLLDAIICRNQFVWAGKPRKQEQQILEAVRMSLDFAAWSLDKRHPRAEMTEDELRRRWPAAVEWFTERALREKAESFRRDKRPA